MQGSSPARRGDFFVAALVTFLLSADSVAAVCRSVEEAEQLLGTPRQVLLGH
jgi:hypothetical protein